jgi:2-C-methyl-D-erythritol 4-phosphate cytidylyltransferase/2-C-methyl-D-erythritol 2,4-cyclodiphosphate synthase
MPPARVAMILVAAGRGSRAGEGLPKQYRPLGGRALLTRTLDAAAACPVGRLVVVIHPDDDALYEAAVADASPQARAKLAAPAFGGATRQASVRAGVEALGDVIDVALVHDAARPFFSPALAARVIEAAGRIGGAVPGLAVTDTIKEIDGAGRVTNTPQRARLRAVQTPQGFRLPLLREAHARAKAAGRDDFTDDAAAVEFAGGAIEIVEGEKDNVKITEAGDFAAAERRMMAERPDVRVGQGYDVHAFGEGEHVWLGGVKIPFGKGLVGHSDADVGLHALTDAIFGALGDGDIGSHFPPSDMRWKGAASDQFLAFAAARVAARGGMIAHLDLTLICEAPKIGPHREAMRARIARIAGVSLDRVGVKATTSERLGFTGRGEGIAALAVATLRLP